MMPTASSSAIILSLSRIPRIDAHSSIFFSGALLSVGSGAGGGVSRSSYSGARNSSAVITVLSGSGFGVVGGVIVGVNVGTCEMPFSRIFERMRSEIRCPGSDGDVVGAVTVCVGLGLGLGAATGFGGSVSISGVTFVADSFSCISAICSAMRSGV